MTSQEDTVLQNEAQQLTCPFKNLFKDLLKDLGVSEEKLQATETRLNALENKMQEVLSRLANSEAQIEKIKMENSGCCSSEAAPGKRGFRRNTLEHEEWVDSTATEAPQGEVMLFVRAVWNENGKEMEGTIPDAWVNVAEKTLRWPTTRAKYCFDNHVAPKEDWETFPLLKVKFTSESLHDCEEYDQTSHAEQCEDEDEDEDVVVKKRMKKTKQFEDFVEGSDLSEATAEGEDKEERKGDASPMIPVFPTPPIKKSKNVGRDRSNSGTARSAGSDRSTSGSPRSAGHDIPTSRTARSAGRDRSTSGTARSAGCDRSTSGSPRSAGHDIPTSRTARSAGSDRSTSEFQKIVLTKLVTLTDEVKKLQRSVPNSRIQINKIDTLEEFEREEASLQDKNKFETLVFQLARVGGEDVKDCTHKVLDSPALPNLTFSPPSCLRGRIDEIVALSNRA
ncbi:serine arginine-rich splicing factor 4-like isoform X6 [Labeo rohita]|uniref:Serine arginine-rich splicing factor 4-like isoform X6 n=1 Tax=Labeo rohita TaxID=84645 RepID=A0A498NQA6_LABRO|nr:serine arginine-rich splicing factor 4-like isoform X6 [Labeo rohita]